MLNRYIVELQADVKNPEPDRRSKDWHRQPVVPSGTRFLVNYTIDGYATIRTADQYGWVADRSDLGRAIMANVERVEPTTWREFAHVSDCDWGADSILRILVKLGRVGPADFEAVAAIPEDF